ncbi:neurexin-3 [Lingula anatina]|uniref:Neurexin-3 n=1 Tax=Lingula anatina TaxID=7574 RepID=A0A1S3KG14_LINAN|nr:neurexin-3 [Lingula anatina]|eukprot:XP_013421404.1 neurexin-3 [Lingula anatina]
MWDAIIKITAFLVTFALRNARGYTIGITSQASYAKYTKWNPCPDGSLKFEFKTQEPDGLLVYLDDGGSLDFIEVKLVDGALQFRYNMGEGVATEINLGGNLNDDAWHSVQIERQDGAVQLVLDAERTSKSVPNDKPQFGELEGNSFLYIAGLPVHFKSDLRSLALPSAAFESPFAGSIRNLLYSNCSKAFGSPILLDSVGIEKDVSDPCSSKNVCMNNGTCLVTDTGAICDCSAINFEGEFCEKASLQSFTVVFTTPMPSSSTSKPVTEARELVDATTPVGGSGSTNGANSTIGNILYCILLASITWKLESGDLL